MADSKVASTTLATRATTPQRSRLAGLARSPRLAWIRVLLRNPGAIIGLTLLFALIILALLAPRLVPYDANALDPGRRLLAPSTRNPLGTDQLGRDVLTRAIHSARVSLPIGLGVTILATVLGSLIGVVSGYYPRADAILMRIMDGLMAFPGILLALALVASLGARVSNVILAIAIVDTPAIARIVRGTTLGTKGMAYVESARAIGARDGRILWRYIFPSALPILIVQATFVISGAILAEASLSFLGVGISSDTPTWGTMLREGQALIARAWWLAVAPGVALFLAILALNLVGDGLRDALDPRLRER